jgi:ribosomal protein S18 acetylase RimI-like enzyme
MKLEAVISFYRRHGFLTLWKRCLETMGTYFFCDRSIIFVSLDFRNIPLNGNAPFHFFLATADDVQKEPEYNDGWYQKSDAITRLHKGHRLFVLMENERMVYSMWAESQDVRIRWLNLRFDLPDRMIYCTASHTIPEFRNKGIARRLDLQIAQYFKKEGFDYAIGVVDPANTASRAVNGKLGVKEYQIVRYRRYGFVKYYRVSKMNSDLSKSFITCFASPRALWKTFFEAASHDSTREQSLISLPQIQISKATSKHG